jgi:hypothetical protein
MEKISQVSEMTDEEGGGMVHKTKKTAERQL